MVLETTAKVANSLSHAEITQACDDAIKETILNDKATSSSATIEISGGEVLETEGWAEVVEAAEYVGLNEKSDFQVQDILTCPERLKEKMRMRSSTRY